MTENLTKNIMPLHHVPLVSILFIFLSSDQGSSVCIIVTHFLPYLAIIQFQIENILLVHNYFANVADVFNKSLSKYKAELVKHLCSTCFKEANAL